ncbi:MAG: heavy-metal-associated domain-containing protein [Bacteroidales bacterium]|nr:heavy-metal-associated domain-containing protein [Bacteroidales bacterium]
MKKFYKLLFLISLSIYLSIDISAQEKNKNVENAEFKVSGVCEMCKERIENAALIKGVKLAEWDKTTGILKVVFVPKKVALQEIQSAIAEAGHDTELVKASDKAYQKLPACCAYRDDVEIH